MYEHVLPRDLFNEAKLLKCLGQLALIIHDGKDKNNVRVPDLEICNPDESREGFIIDLDVNTGQLYCSNLVFCFKGVPLSLGTFYNSTSPYPIYFEVPCEDGNLYEGLVFNDDGTLHDLFIAFMKDFKPLDNTDDEY